LCNEKERKKGENSSSFSRELKFTASGTLGDTKLKKATPDDNLLIYLSLSFASHGELGRNVLE